MIPVTIAPSIFRTVHVLAAILLISSADVQVSAACYYPDGSVAQDIPCTDSTDESTCCGPGFACLGHSSSFFLCQATGEEFQRPDASEFVRGSCTDQSWRSSNCPNVCVDPNRDNTAGGHGVAACPRSDTRFYCISTGLSEEDCSTGHNLIEFVNKPSVLTTIGVIPSSTSSRAASSTTSTVPTTDGGASPGTTDNTNSAAGPVETSSSSNGTTIGIAVGVSIGVLGLLAAGIFGWLLMRKRRNQAPPPPPSAEPGNDMPAMATTTLDSRQNQESHSQTPIYTSADPYKQGPESHASYVYTPAPSEAPGYEHGARFELPGAGISPSAAELDPQSRRS